VATGAVPAPAAVSLPSTAPSSASSAAASAATTAIATAAPAAARTLTAAVPKITGTAKVGQKLTVNRGTWTSGTTLTQRWYRNKVAIPGATGTTYTPTAADRGVTITVAVTGSKAGYATRTTSSSKTRPVAVGTLTAPTPKISGTAKAGGKLAVSRGTWTSGTKLTQRWYRNGAAISGATGTSYTVKSGDVGANLTVRVSGAKTGYASVTKTSATVKVAKAAASTRAKPNGKNCPASHPIKGNRPTDGTDWKYHVPGGQYYARTVPEECFKTAAAAQKAGYRASKK
jgi:hypothetical protein